ncbi:helix-turn-helix DNA binding protein [Rhodococcus phage Shagrat]|nr:helix-turn-helix DNA binding protein [Rhodococcus phage Shagrat]
MPLVKTAAQINREISATMPTPPPPPAPESPDRRLRVLQYALLEQIRIRPYWAVDREFWRFMAGRLHIQPYQVRKVFQTLERDGYILVSERDNPRLVWAKERGRR